MTSACWVLVSLLAAAPSPPPTPEGEVLGTVVDGLGNPVAGARIGELRPGAGGFDVFNAPIPFGEVATDRDGRFVLRTAPGRVAIVASRGTSSDPPITVRLVPVTVPAGKVSVVIPFDGTESVRGRALDPRGQALAHVRVTILPERTGPAATGDAVFVRTWTDDDGSFEITGLKPGAHRLLARGGGFSCVEACEFGAGMRVRAGDGGVAVPLAASGSIRGRVVRATAAGVAPVRSFVVRSAAFPAYRYDVEDGRFALDVQRLWAGAPFFVEARGLAPHAGKFDLQKPVEVDLGDIVMGEGRSVRGRVHDATGRPVEGALVRLGFANQALEWPEAKTDAAGRFELGPVSEGDTSIVVAHQRFRTRELPVAARAPDLDVELRPSATLDLHVVAEDGAPVAGAQVWNARDPSSWCRSGQDGSCAMHGLDPAQEVVLDARVSGSPWPVPRQLRVPAAALATPLTWRLPQALRTLRVLVLTSGGQFTDGDASVLPGDVSLERAVGARGEVLAPFHAAGIDLEKRFENLPAGPYTIVAADSDRTRCKVVRVDLAKPDEVVQVRLPEAPGPCRR